MRRIAFVIGGLATALALTACGGPAPTTAPPAGTDTSAPASEPTKDTSQISIGSVVYKFDDTFMSSMRNAMTAQAQAKGVKLDIQDGQNDQAKENEIVNTFITQGVSVLAINPVKADIVDPVLQAAKGASLPLVFFNKQPSPEVMSSYDKVFYVGARAEDSGTMMGEMLVDYFKQFQAADKNGDGKVQFVLLTGEMNHQDAIARSKYSQQALQDAGLIDGFDKNTWAQDSPANNYMLANQSANWNTGEATDLMNNWITSIGLDKIEAVIANNDDMGLGAIAALQASGFNKPGAAKGDPKAYIPVVSVDATDKGMAALKDGTLLGTVLNDAENQGKAVINLSIAAVNGDVSKETVGYEVTDGQFVWIPYVKVTEAK